MKLQIKQLEKNPFRDLKNFPLKEEKISSLKKSIAETGFWDNLLCRKNKNNKYEIAYGHHRLAALKELKGQDFITEIPVKNLNDDLMLKIMANENMEDWGHSVALTDETVKMTINHLEKNNIKPTADVISDFLGWAKGKIINSIARINHIKAGISKKALESLSSSAAAKFAASVSKNNYLKNNTELQEELAELLVKEDVSRNDIKYRVAEFSSNKKFPSIKSEKEQKIKTANENLRKVLLTAEELTLEVVKIKQNLSLFSNTDRNTLYDFADCMRSLKELQEEINKTLEKLN